MTRDELIDDLRAYEGLAEAYFVGQCKDGAPLQSFADGFDGGPLKVSKFERVRHEYIARSG